MSLPPLPDTFEWTSESWGSALRCRPLTTVAPHLFTTRQLQLSPDSDLRPLAEAIGAGSVFLPQQVHGRAATVIGDDRMGPGETAEGDLVQADVVVSRSIRLAIGVRAADCVPLLMADARTGAVAAVHAGWRGTAASAAVAAVEALGRSFGSRPADLIVAIGPSIGPCCYEVGSELVDAFAAAGHSRDLIARWFLAPPPRRGSSGPRIDRPAMHLDLPGANRDQLILAGVPASRIHLSGLCTAMHLEVLTSYRAEGPRATRLIAAIRRAT